MFYDKNGSEIEEGCTVEFYSENYVIEKINGDNYGTDGTSTLSFDKKPHVDKVPDEASVTLVTL